MAFSGNPEIVDYGPYGSEVIRHCSEGDSETFLAGQFVALDISENGIVAVADEGTELYGIALKDATGTTASSIPVAVIYPGMRIKIKLSNNGTDVTYVQATHQFEQFGLNVASNVCKLDNQLTTVGTNTVGTVVDGWTDGGGDYTAWVLFEFSNTALQVLQGAQA